MKKVNDFIDRICGNFLVVFILLVLMLYSFFGMAVYRSWLLGLLAITLFYFLCFLAIRDLKSRTNFKLTAAEAKYADLLELVSKKAESFTEKLLAENECYSLFISSRLNFSWLIDFDRNLSLIKENLILGTPDSFVEAAVLIISIINNNCIISDYESEDTIANKIQEKIVFSVNVRFAFEVAFDMISYPITYYQSSDDQWIEQKPECSKVNIIVPDGIIKNSPLYRRIVNTVINDYNVGIDISVMQLSNMLHLIYLYSRDCGKII